MSFKCLSFRLRNNPIISPRNKVCEDIPPKIN